MKCPKCHSENPETQRFCGECGKALRSPESDDFPDLSVTKTLGKPADRLTRGGTFANRYEIIEELGKGGLGSVYRAEDTKVGGEVAVKLISPAIANDAQTIERFRHLLQLNLANAVEESESLRSLPLPHVVVKPVVSTVGEVLLDTTLETISTTLDSQEGQDAVQALADSILEAVFYGPGLAELEALAKDISLQVIDHMKEVVAVKKWALPDEQAQRPPMPWESDEPSEP